jgi:hypothetical protein
MRNTSLGLLLCNFLRENNIQFYGTTGPIRGSKCCSVYIYKSDSDRIEEIQGGKYETHQFWFSKEMTFEDSVLYNVSCRKI